MAADTTLVPMTPEQESPRRLLDRPELVFLVALTLGALVFIAVRLGPSLLGFKAFGGFDMLMPRSPWWNGGPVTKVQNPWFGDSFDALYPTSLQMHQRLFSGDLPLWSSLSGPGSPLMSTPAVPTLTPAGIWNLLLPLSWSTGFAKFVELVISGLGMTLWLRRMGTPWAAGALSALLYWGSGFSVAWTNWAGQSNVAATIPVLFWLVERLVQKRTLKSALPIAAPVAFLMLGGFPAVAGHALYFGAGYLVVRLLAERAELGWPHVARMLGSAALAVTLGFGLSAIQLLPQLRGLQQTDLAYRSAKFDLVQPMKSLLTLIVPRTFEDAQFPGSNPIEAYAF